MAYLFYVVSPSLPESLATSFKGLHTLIYNKYFVDEFYDATVVEPMVDGSRQSLARGRCAGDRRRGQRNREYRRGLGGILRRAQSGYIRSYAAWVLAGSILAIAYIGFMGLAR